MPRDLKIPDQRHPEKAHRAETARVKKPDWIRVKAPSGEGYKATKDIMRQHNLVTVCEEAGCPNVGECWSQGHATMMIMGEILHPRLHLLQRRHWPPRRAGCVRAGTRGGCGQEAGPESRGHYVC